MPKRIVALLASWAIWLFLVACQSPLPLPSTPSIIPSATPEPACTVLALPTGEKIIPVTVGTPPPPQVRPGETIHLSFSGGFIIYNHTRTCGDDGVVEYVFADELPGFSYRRTVAVTLDDTSLADLPCELDCPLDVTIPGDIEPGVYRLRLMPRYRFKELDFELAVWGTPLP